MKNIFMLLLLTLMGSLLLSAKSIEHKKDTKEKLTEKHLKEQMEREKKFAKEQRFYKGKEYDISAQKIDPKDLDSIPLIEPENDFDMTDVYRDDI